MSSNIRDSAWLLSLLSAGLIVRLYAVSSQSLWTDEIITFITAADSPFKIIVDPYDMNIPPLYYLIQHFLLRLSDGEFILRLPSVVFASLSIPVFFLMVSHWCGRAVGFTGAALMVISPFHVWYSQEARPYALLIALSLLAIWSFQQLLKSPSSILWKTVFSLSTALTFYAHTVGLVLIALLATYVIIAAPYSQWRRWLVLFTTIAVLVTPAIYRLLVNPPTGSADAFHSTQPLAAIAYTVWAFATGFSIGPTVAELHLPERASIIREHLPFILPVMSVVCGLAIFGAYRLLSEDRQRFWFVCLWLCFPLGFALLGSILTVHPFNVRYSILAFPPFLTLLSVGIVHIQGRWQRTLGTAVIFLISVGSLANYFFNERYQRDDNRSASRFLSLHALPNDLVIATAAYTAPNLRYYYRGEPITIVGYPTRKSPIEDSSIHPDPPGALFVENGHAVGGDIEQIIAGRERVWLFLSRVFHSDPHGVIPEFLDSRYERQLSASWPGAELILYETRSDSAKANGE